MQVATRFHGFHRRSTPVPRRSRWLWPVLAGTGSRRGWWMALRWGRGCWADRGMGREIGWPTQRATRQVTSRPKTLGRVLSCSWTHPRGGVRRWFRAVRPSGLLRDVGGDGRPGALDLEAQSEEEDGPRRHWPIYRQTTMTKRQQWRGRRRRRQRWCICRHRGDRASCRWISSPTWWRWGTDGNAGW